jgi:hypothetical protein
MFDAPAQSAPFKHLVTEAVSVSAALQGRGAGRNFFAPLRRTSSRNGAMPGRFIWTGVGWPFAQSLPGGSRLSRAAGDFFV